MGKKSNSIEVAINGYCKKIISLFLVIVLSIFAVNQTYYAMPISKGDNDNDLALYMDNNLVWVKWENVESVININFSKLDAVYINSDNVENTKYDYILELIDNGVLVVIETNGQQQALDNLMNFFGKDIMELEVDVNLVDGVEMSKSYGVLNISYIQYSVVDIISLESLDEIENIEDISQESMNLNTDCEEINIAENMNNIMSTHLNVQKDIQEMYETQDDSSEIKPQVLDLECYKYFSGSTIYILDITKVNVGSVRIQTYVYRIGYANSKADMIEDVLAKVTVTSFNNRYVRQFGVSMEIPSSKNSSITDYVSFDKGEKETLSSSINIDTKGIAGVTGSATTTVTYDVGDLYVHVERNNTSGLNNYNKMDWLFTSRTSSLSVDYNASKVVTPGIRIQNKVGQTKKVTITVSGVYFLTRTDAYYMCLNPITNVCSWK